MTSGTSTRRTVRVLAPLLCACLAAGCSDRRAQARIDDSGPPIRGGTLEIVNFSDVDHLATTSAYLNTSMWLSRTFARQLVAYPPTGNEATTTRSAADIAVEIPTTENGGISADGLSYTFRLRRGVRWNSSPPREVTAHDIVRAVKLLCNPVSPAGPIGYYTSTIAGLASYCERFARVDGTVPAIREFVTTQSLEGVRAVDDFTVVFRLQAPASDFLYLVAMPCLSPVPIEYLDYLPDSPEFRQHTLSSGPYRIARYIQNRELLLERNPAWDSATDPIRPAHVERIRVRLGIDAQLQQLQIEAGTADLSSEETRASDAGPLLAIDDPGVWLSPPGDSYALFTFLLLNHVSPNNRGALGRLEVRQAIALAVDKAAVVQVIGGPRVARPLHQSVIRSASGYTPGADQYVTPGNRGDPDTARRLLAQAGYPAGLSVRLAYGIYASVPLTAQVLQASLARAGITVQLVPLTVDDLSARLLSSPENARRGEWDLAVWGSLPDWHGQNNGRSVIGPLFHGAEGNLQNYGRYRNPHVDAAIDRASVAPRADLSELAWREAARQVMEDVALVPLTEGKMSFTRSRRVRNCTWDVFGFNCNLTSVWLADASPDGEASR